jgi:hypothetical protein
VSRAAAPDSRRLERLGEYAIHRVIGEGGMGIVYEATERLSGRRVALKVLHSSLTRDEGARERFFGEMRIMAGLEHANIVRSLASAEIDGKLVMVLEYLEGRTLREELALRGRLPVGLTITVASAIASALGAAHGSSPCVVHRDLKPENVMLAADGRIKVMDFGIAKVLGDGNTQTTQAVGTVRYMSPEQAGGGVISPQTDLYALGLLIFEMLTGKAPFESPSLLAILRHHCETPAPPLPDDVRAETPPALEELMHRLLEKDPRARPAGALPVLDALVALAAPQPVAAASAGGAATPPAAARGKAFSPGPRTPDVDTIGLVLRLEKRRRWPYLVAFAALVAAVTGIVALTRGATSDGRAGSPRAAAAAPPDVPAVAPAPCPEEATCAPFTPADPRAVAAETILGEGELFARTLDPRATLVNATLLDAVVDGLVDTTRSFAHINLFYAMPDGGIIVQLKAGRFVGVKSPSLTNNEPFAPATCPLRRAWELAFGGRVVPGPKSRVSLVFNHRQRGPAWSLGAGMEAHIVDASTCVLVTTADLTPPR